MKLKFRKYDFGHIFTKEQPDYSAGLISETPKLMHLNRLFFILLFSCHSFCSYGKVSSATSDTIKFYKNQLQPGARVSGNVLSFNASYRSASTYPSLSRSTGFQLYAGKHRPSTFKINFHDSFLSKPPTIPLRNEHAGIWKKVGRAELFIGGVEVIGMVALIMMPKEITKWPDDWAQDAIRNLKRAFTTTPVWDRDDWALNYIGHPIAGSYYYNALRSQNASRFHSFLFSTAQSFIWEYFIEGMAERPSAQDLLITPVVGSLLGETTHAITMNMRRNGFNLFEKVFVLLLNPMYVINNGFGTRFNPAFAKR
jgi:hypothetical protein